MSKQVTWYESDSRSLANSIAEELLTYDLTRLSPQGLKKVIAEQIKKYIGV